VRYTYEGPELWCVHCHCESCRRATSSGVATFISVPRQALHFIGQAPKAYLSSPGVRRTFCETCGSPIAYEGQGKPDEVHLYAATLDDSSHLQPSAHDFYDEHVSWLKLADGLPHISE
jgi:hypothetical protein